MLMVLTYMYVNHLNISGVSMKTIFYLPVLGTAAFLSLSTHVALAEETSYEFSGFSRILVSEGIDVKIVSGAPDYRVVAQSEGLAGTSPVKISQYRDRLKIERKRRLSPVMRMLDGPLKVTVELPELSRLSVQEGSQARLAGTVASELDLIVSTGSEVQADGISAKTIHLEVSTGSELEITGQCQRLEVKGSQGADIDAYGLQCAEVHVAAKMGADINVTATQSLSAKAFAGGDISVQGHPAQTDISSAFGGAVQIEG